MLALTDKEKSLIIKNVLSASKDISKLNKRGYSFLYLCSGFIAHYNLHGFIAYYSYNNLINDILQNERFNQWDNFSKLDKDYDYYMSKKEVYNTICEEL